MSDGHAAGLVDDLSPRSSTAGFQVRRSKGVVLKALGRRRPRSKSIPASWAIAGKCSPALVEPPVQAATTTRGVLQRFARHHVARAEIFLAGQQVHHRATGGLAIGVPALIGGRQRRRIIGSARPIASATQAMVLAVNCPPQAPADGTRDALQARASSASVMPFAPAADGLPTASNTSCTVTSRPSIATGQDRSAIEEDTLGVRSAGPSPSSCPASSCRTPRARPARRSNGRAWSAPPCRRSPPG